MNCSVCEDCGWVCEAGRTRTRDVTSDIRGDVFWSSSAPDRDAVGFAKLIGTFGRNVRERLREQPYSLCDAWARSGEGLSSRLPDFKAGDRDGPGSPLGNARCPSQHYPHPNRPIGHAESTPDVAFDATSVALNATHVTFWPRTV
jgi:hypothetical protein